MLFRLTKKAQEQIKVTPQSSGEAENRYCEWICDVMQCGRKKYFLVSNAYSSFSIFFDAKGLTTKEKFIEFVSAKIKEYFYSKTLGTYYKCFIESNLENISFAKTNSRTMTGILNEQKRFIEYKYYDEGDFSDNFDASNYLNDMVSCALHSMFKKFNPDQMIVSEYMENPVLPEGIPAKYKEWR